MPLREIKTLDNIQELLSEDQIITLEGIIKKLLIIKNDATGYFIASIFAKNLAIIEKLKDYASIETLNQYRNHLGQSLLVETIYNCDFSIVLLLLEMGVNPHPDGIFAATIEYNPLNTKALEQLKAIIHLKWGGFDTQAYLPGLFTSTSLPDERVSSILNTLADDYPVPTARIKKIELLIPLLFSAGAKTNIKDKTGKTAIDYCTQPELQQCKKWLELGESIENMENYALSLSAGTKLKVQNLANELRQSVFTIAETKSTFHFETLLHKLDNDIVLSRQPAFKIAVINIGLCILGLGMIYLAAGIAHLIATSGNHFLFFTQNKEGMKVEQALHHCVDNLELGSAMR